MDKEAEMRVHESFEAGAVLDGGDDLARRSAGPVPDPTPAPDPDPAGADERDDGWLVDAA